MEKLHKNIQKLKRLQKNNLILYRNCKVTKIRSDGIMVWELYGPDMSDFVPFKEYLLLNFMTCEPVDWTKFKVTTPIKF